MRLIIDGHNLIGQMFDIFLSDPHDEEKLIRRLERYHADTGTPITVVFDPGGHPSSQRKILGQGISVLWAPPGSSADGLIRLLLEKSTYPRGLTVVSSDREVRKAARVRRAKVMRAERFARELSKKRKSTAPQNQEKGEGLSEAEIEEWMRLFQGGGQT